MIRKMLSIFTIMAVILAIPVFSHGADSADTESSATLPKPEIETISPKTNTIVQTNKRISAFPSNKAYTLEEMLRYAMLDEYAAQALYGSAITRYDAGEPFERFYQEVSSLSDLLTQLMVAHAITLPNLKEIDEKPTEDSLRAIYLAGIKDEKISTEMYITFLAKDNLPDDVEDVFKLLLAASQGRLDELTAKVMQEGWLQVTQKKDDRDDDDDKYDDDDTYDDDDKYDDDEDKDNDDDDDDKDNDDHDDKNDD